MPAGPGKYDAECSFALQAADARAVVLIVLGGNRGDGFAVQSVSRDIEALLPTMLRDLAGEIESIRRGQA